jgi:predicted DNA-binding transcriptional regulator AlpA
MMNMHKPDPAIDLDAVKQLTGLSKTTIYDHIKNGKFVPGFLVSARARRWMLSDVENWLKSKKEQGANQ